MTDIVTPEVLWWALLPVLFLSAGGMLLLTVASLVRRLSDALPQVWTVALRRCRAPRIWRASPGNWSAR